MVLPPAYKFATINIVCLFVIKDYAFILQATQIQTLSKLKIVYGYSYSFQDFRIPLFDYLKSIFLSLSCSTTTVAVASCIEVILESQLERTIVSLVYLEERHVLIIECKVPSAFV